MARILVTGSCGFIGYHLVKRLTEEGNEVIGIDNEFSGRNRNKLEHLKGYTHVVGDVRYMSSFNGTGKLDQIYNLACPASPPRYQADPLFTTQTCVIGANNCARLANHFESTLLHASTSEVYGDAIVHPQSEDYTGNVNIVGVRSCYDEGKRCAESILMDHHRIHHTNVKIARIFNTYGPHMDPEDGRVISNFIVSRLKNKPLTVYGEGTQTRSFCYIDDMVEGLIRLMNSDHIGPMNIGNPNEFSISQLAQMVGGEVNYLPLPSDDPKQRCPDITLAKSKLYWEPMVMLEEGVRKTTEHYEQLIHERVGDV